MRKINYLILLAFTLTMLSCNTTNNKQKDTKEGAINTDTSKPNVIFIMTDDHGAIDANCYGSHDLITPSIDRLAKEGVRFDQFYASAGVCAPSRASMLTGKTNWHAGVYGNVPIPEGADKFGEYGLPTDEYTIAEMLKDNGYRTALVGKWHEGHRPQNLPNAQGFDYFFGHQRGCIDNYSHFFYWDGPNIHDLYRNSEEVYYPGQHFSDLMTDEVSKYITGESEYAGDTKKPFFIYWAFNAPHYPYQGDPKWLETYKDMPMPRKLYAAFLSHMDERIGKVLDLLDKQGIADNTIVILQGDNGYSTEIRAFGGGGSAGHLRGNKFSLLEGGIRVPAIIRYPNKVKANEVRKQPSISYDWMPTIAEYTGIEAPKNIEGKSLCPVIESADAKPVNDIMYWEVGQQGHADNQWAIRKGDWKLVVNANEPGHGIFKGEDKFFLSNIAEDETESTNLAKRHPDIVKELIKEHDIWHDKDL